MALQPVRGVLVLEGVQTGDGRFIVPDGIEWVGPPIPLAVLRDGDQHVDLIEVAPQVGTIDTITRADGGRIEFTGSVDDAIPDGAEVLRRMDEGSAPLGPRWGVSIDPDNYEVELILNTDDDDDDGGIVILAAAGQVTNRHQLWSPARHAFAAAGLVAAAGDGDPSDTGELLFATSVDEIVERYTRLRIRGATLCAVAAFDGTYVERDGGTPVEPADEAVTAAARAAAETVPVPDAPPRAWFDDPALPMPSPLTITNEGRVLGHVAAWGTCHTGYTDRCVTPPRGGDYHQFTQGNVVTDDGPVRTGVLAWGIPHADLTLPMIQAMEHYADARYGWADVTVGEDEHGIWFSGALRPGLTPADLRVLRGLSLSGDWRMDWNLNRLRLIAALSVNYPGFPIPDAAVTADARARFHNVVEPAAALDGDRVTALIASGMVPPDGCGCGDEPVDRDALLADLAATVHRLDLRTRHLVPHAAASALERIGPPPAPAARLLGGRRVRL